MGERYNTLHPRVNGFKPWKSPHKNPKPSVKVYCTVRNNRLFVTFFLYLYYIFFQPRNSNKDHRPHTCPLLDLRTRLLPQPILLTLPDTTDGPLLPTFSLAPLQVLYLLNIIMRSTYRLRLVRIVYRHQFSMSLYNRIE